MHRIDANIAGQALRGRRFANANGHRCRSRAVPHQALLAIRFTATQVVQVRDGYLREPGVACIAELLDGAAQQHLGCRSRERVVQTVSLSQQCDILNCVLANKTGPADPLARLE